MPSSARRRGEWPPATTAGAGIPTLLPSPAGRTLAALIAHRPLKPASRWRLRRAAAGWRARASGCGWVSVRHLPKPTWSGHWLKSGAFLKWPRRFHLFDEYKSVMPGLKREARLRADVPGIHVLTAYQRKRTWMAGTSPAMTKIRDCFYSYFDAPVSRYASGGEFAIRGLVTIGRHRWLRVTSENIPAAICLARAPLSDRTSNASTVWPSSGDIATPTLTPITRPRPGNAGGNRTKTASQIFRRRLRRRGRPSDSCSSQNEFIAAHAPTTRSPSRAIHRRVQ